MTDISIDGPDALKRKLNGYQYSMERENADTYAIDYEGLYSLLGEVEPVYLADNRYEKSPGHTKLTARQAQDFADAEEEYLQAAETTVQFIDGILTRSSSGETGIIITAGEADRSWYDGEGTRHHPLVFIGSIDEAYEDILADSPAPPSDMTCDTVHPARMRIQQYLGTDHDAVKGALVEDDGD